jgi:hypothetical protein
MLLESGLIKEVETENGLLVITLKENITPGEINSYAFTREVVIEHMLSRKKSLESQFLELVKEE